MIDTKKIEQLAKQITDSIPPGVRGVADNVEARVKQTLQQQLSKLDVVSREEFEIQQQMLLRLRQRIEVLEQQSAQSAEPNPTQATDDPHEQV
ncbi:MAG: accessory factor UbiK family protein [Idiomarina sp.]|nr:accessory factor UbiK family protein [Idiomarina sp.]